MIFEQNLQFNIYYLLALINNNEIVFIKNKKLIIDSDLIVTQSNIFFPFQHVNVIYLIVYKVILGCLNVWLIVIKCIKFVDLIEKQVFILIFVLIDSFFIFRKLMFFKNIYIIPKFFPFRLFVKEYFNFLQHLLFWHVNRFFYFFELKQAWLRFFELRVKIC
jgi:hypothetical protein